MDGGHHRSLPHCALLWQQFWLTRPNTAARKQKETRLVPQLQPAIPHPSERVRQMGTVTQHEHWVAQGLHTAQGNFWGSHGVVDFLPSVIRSWGEWLKHSCRPHHFPSASAAMGLLLSALLSASYVLSQLPGRLHHGKGLEVDKSSV